MSVFTPFAFQGAASQTRTAFNFVTGSSSTDVQITFVAFTPYYPFPSVYLDDENLATATTVYAGSTGLTKNSNSFYISDVDFCKGNLDQTIYRYYCTKYCHCIGVYCVSHFGWLDWATIFRCRIKLIY